MAIIPDDAQQILGLQADGKAVTEEFDNKFLFKDIYKLSQKLFGWNQVETESVLEMKDGRLSKNFNLKKLRDKLWEIKKIFDNEGRVNPVQINATALAYLLYVLGKCIFPDSSGSLVEASYLQLLNPLYKMGEYSWGTAVWIYEHLPSLFKTNSYVKVDESVAVNKPRAQRYSFKGTKDKEMQQQLIKLRNAIDKLTADEVIFDSYRDARNQGLIQRRDEVVALYYGPLMTTFDGYSMYDPHRVMRQLGYIQEEPHFDEEKSFFTEKMAECTTSQKTINVSYDPAPVQKHWDNRRVRKSDVSLLDEVTTGHEATEKYMAWYLGWARPTVIREMTVEELARNKKMESKDPATMLKFFVSILELLLLF
ncbi:protein MAINTENANCE OF MERISTEMS-like [Papaver somniferum]|uniref:protein MAINTENANCE OF MERISTEMS-like n=1 Tax=Papaver somniferum TaxID=3469 RepID=UPI000E6F55CC|nr:protein MAINTENANCE OF MERISTEMS-like [Papaver somniferum]